MANWAIVIGINEYWKPEASLRGAVADALKITNWLTDQDGGNVPPRNLFLLTHPLTAGGDAPHPNIRLSGATKGDLVNAMDGLINRSEGSGERLFFYFSGHGLINRQNFTDEQAIVMSDFSNTRPDNAVSLRTIQEYFRATEFAEQFFFIDACRNVLNWNHEFRIGDFPLVLTPDASRSAPEQHFLFATSPRLRAVELNEAGAFTEILLDGLRGKGAAKVYSVTDDEYHVSMERLSQFVISKVEAKNIIVTDPSVEPPFVQKPRYSVFERRDEDPILARFNPAEVEPEELDIYVEPNSIWADTEVVITSEDSEYNERIRPVRNVPLVLPRKARPMSYTVRASAPNHEPEKRRWSFDLYEPTRVDVKLKPLAVVTLPNSEPTEKTRNVPSPNTAPTPSNWESNWDSSESSGSGSESDYGYNETFSVGTAPTARSIDELLTYATLTVKSSDSLAPLEIYDNAGKFIASGRGELTLNNLKKGFYRARLVTPEGRVSEEVIELEAGESERLDLDAPPPPETPLFKTIVDQTNFDVSDDNTVHVSEMVGSMATAQLSTMMMLTGSIVDEQYGWGKRVSGLGLRTFADASGGSPCGLRVVFADELVSGSQSTNLERVRLGLLKQGEDLPEMLPRVEFSRMISGLAQAVQAAPPGAYILSVELPEQNPAYFSIAVLPHRMTLLSIQQRADGGIRLFTFCPSAQPEDLPEADAKNLRRLELLQRFHLNGRVDDKHAYQNAWELLDAKFIDPFAGCLGGYTMLQLGKANELSVAVYNMTNLYSELSDSFVLAAEYNAQNNSVVGARNNYHTALERGIPVFAEGLRRLVEGIEKYEISHPRAALVKQAFERRAPNTLLTVWTNEA